MSVGRKSRKPIPRYTELRSSGRIAPTPRKASERKRIYGTDAHQKWLRDMPCLGCGRMGAEDRPHHLHHVRTGGMGYKANADRQVPLCDDCHGFVHQRGRVTFEAAFSDMLAGRTLASWATTYAEAWAKWSGEVAS